jgi:hypothetical protein
MDKNGKLCEHSDFFDGHSTKVVAATCGEMLRKKWINKAKVDKSYPKGKSG